MSADNKARPQHWQERGIGLVLLLLGAGIIFGTFSVGALPGQDSLGPRLFPALIGGGLILLGLAHFRPGRSDTREGHADEGHWPSLLWMMGGLVLGVICYKPVGFIPAALAVFVLTARGFAGRWDWRHVVAGLIVALIAFFGFTKGLGLNLPTGILKFMLGGH
ncbi:tripartite tricarboxylate transporter TctB family protein [Dongia rigui]|uniref:Tripartite tricarboxylate transporter TctB family protein n=1 Tax=Dongia rigui TaxID=940149 RepID=A0ABU5DVX0_9PROT|nr:tripartite tricarboxylate transporter TctB family protein [Dongia rigui]MDY0871454.1 tripartite tricarboxylate transporter TctB family protein [Dongia rigui]